MDNNRSVWSSGSSSRTAMLSKAIDITKASGLNLASLISPPRVRGDRGIDAERGDDRRQAENDTVADQKIPVERLQRLPVEAPNQGGGHEARKPDDAGRDSERRTNVEADDHRNEDRGHGDFPAGQPAKQRQLQIDPLVRRLIGLSRAQDEPKTAQRPDGGEQRQGRRGDEPVGEIEAGPACFGNEAEPQEVGAGSIQEDVEQRACADESRQSEKRAFRAAVL